MSLCIEEVRSNNMRYRCLNCDHVQEGDPDHLPVCEECGEVMEAHD